MGAGGGLVCLDVRDHPHAGRISRRTYLAHRQLQRLSRGGREQVAAVQQQRLHGVEKHGGGFEGRPRRAPRQLRDGQTGPCGVGAVGGGVFPCPGPRGDGGGGGFSGTEDGAMRGAEPTHLRVEKRPPVRSQIGVKQGYNWTVSPTPPLLRSDRRPQPRPIVPPAR